MSQADADVIERWWIDPRIADRFAVGSERLRTAPTRNRALLARRMKIALDNASSATYFSRGHGRKGNAEQSRRWQAEADRQAAEADRLIRMLAWLTRDVQDYRALAALALQRAAGRNSPTDSIGASEPRQTWPTAKLGARRPGSPRGPSVLWASVAA